MLRLAAFVDFPAECFSDRTTDAVIGGGIMGDKEADSKKLGWFLVHKIEPQVSTFIETQVPHL
jgi:hypothetical protein